MKIIRKSGSCGSWFECLHCGAALEEEGDCLRHPSTVEVDFWFIFWRTIPTTCEHVGKLIPNPDIIETR